MITVTSAEAAKILQKLNDERNALLEREDQLAWFLCASTEDPEANRPEYDMAEYHEKLRDLEAKIRAVKHAINVFNMTHEVEGLSMTIDQVLVYIPQLSEQKRYLRAKAQSMPKERQDTMNSPIIDYRYANFDPAAARTEYDRVSSLLAKAQLGLDKVNQTQTMEIDITL